LLKHLPYIDLSGHEYVVAPETQPTDYRGEAFQYNVTKESIGKCTPLGNIEFPEWVINLTHGNSDGTYVMLDTKDGRSRFLVGLRVMEMTDWCYRDRGAVQYSRQRKNPIQEG
jgi:hypothetical protein